MKNKSFVMTQLAKELQVKSNEIVFGNPKISENKFDLFVTIRSHNYWSRIVYLNSNSEPKFVVQYCDDYGVPLLGNLLSFVNDNADAIINIYNIIMSHPKYI
ncbi:putative ORFan [Tupanvirus deep ocean]|uniref:ORFan n=2 Tax=Tupanvirus TaxID=2094720 RepID=A0AC62AA42_9VIRU|nr:putative ORFan [Tupanvirus deep ocean]QKU34493.1 putative ORFan [Tupanvirus deep ocean]